jgi:small subunit ribosomal protein S8e
MTIFQGKSRKKPTGGKLRASRSKRRFELGREPTLTRVGTDARKVIRTLGGNNKAVLMRTEVANVYVPADKATKKVKIQTVKENPANPHYVQRNIINRGTVIQTELGDARVTSRPGQDGVVNAVLL